MKFYPHDNIIIVQTKDCTSWNTYLNGKWYGSYIEHKDTTDEKSLIEVRELLLDQAIRTIKVLDEKSEI